MFLGLFHVIGGQRNNRNLQQPRSRAVRTNQLRHLNTIHFRHLHIHQDQAETLPSEFIPCFKAVIHYGNLATCFDQQSLNQTLADQVVFGRQYIQGLFLIFRSTLFSARFLWAFTDRQVQQE